MASRTTKTLHWWYQATEINGWEHKKATLDSVTAKPERCLSGSWRLRGARIVVPRGKGIAAPSFVATMSPNSQLNGQLSP